MTLTLSELYVDHLDARDAPAAAALARALEPSRPLEAHLLAAYAARGEHALTIGVAPWMGAQTWIGPRLPPDPSATQIWFDTCEVSAMALVPREPPASDWDPDAVRRWTPFVGWLSLRPVALWQFQVFLRLVIDRQAVAPVASPSGHVPYDLARILTARDGGALDETRPVTGLTAAEAKAFADWMGKALPGQAHWEQARRLRPNAIDLLWGDPTKVKKEWIGYPELDSDEATAISPATIDADMLEERDLEEPPPSERRTLYRYNDWSRLFGFRTFVWWEIGLLGRDSFPWAYER